MPRSPYADLSRPPLSPVALGRALVVSGGLWREVRVVAETGSTNADVAAAARDGGPEGLIVVAENQVAGRGRLGRRWQAPAQSAITVSVLLRPAGLRVGWLPLLAGVAVAEAIGQLAEVDAVLKWPNDVLVRPAAPAEPGRPGEGEYRKCAGILAEAVPDGVVLGIGLNVSQRADELPEPADPTAYRPTSLALAGAAIRDRPPLLKAILRGLADRYRAFRDSGGDPVASGLAGSYRALCSTLGQDVSVRLPGGVEVRGRASDIDAGGRLVVSTVDGPHALAAGDVHRVRPSS